MTEQRLPTDGVAIFKGCTFSSAGKREKKVSGCGWSRECQSTLRTATLKEVGELLSGKPRIYSVGYGFASIITTNELQALMQGKMPGEGK